MTMDYKKQLLQDIEKAFDEVTHGRIIIDIRGDTSPVDIVVEKRQRYTRLPGSNKIKK